MASRGKYRESITVQTLTYGQNAYGETTTSWATFASRFAKVRAATGTEILQQEELQGRQSWVIECPFVVGLDQTMRIIWDQPWESSGRVFNIVYAESDHTHRREHIIYCTELVDAST